MQKTRTRVLAAAMALIALAGFAGESAAATKGYVPHNVNLRAGPGREYPIVVGALAGMSMTVYGCISGWRWCDVNYRGHRGWISGRDLVVDRNRRRVSVIDIGPRLGLSVVLFDRDNYWDRHYSKRSFYRDYYRTHRRDRDRHDHRHDHDRRDGDRGDRDRDRDNDGDRRGGYQGRWND